MSTEADASGADTTKGSLTLHRGLLVLEYLASDNAQSATVAEIATDLDMHRQAVYRLLATLNEHQLVTRPEPGRYSVGLGLLRLARSASPALQRATTPHLRRLAEELEVTAHCTVADGDEAVTLNVVEPPGTAFHLSQRMGSRFPLEQAASGLAILAGRPRRAGEDEAVTIGREAGYVVTQGKVTEGAVGVAVPLHGRDGTFLEASVGVVSMGELDVDEVGERLRSVALAITAEED